MMVGSLGPQMADVALHRVGDDTSDSSKTLPTQFLLNDIYE